MIDPGLTNKVVLVTGANHGIGAAIASACAAQGAKVCLTYYRNPTPYSPDVLQHAQAQGIGGDILYRAMQQQSPEPLLEHIRAAGGFAIAHEADLGISEAIPQVFDLCETQLGPVDMLVNNHTLCVLETFDPALVSDADGGVHLITAAGIDAHFAVNTRAYALLMAEYFKRYRERKATSGRIINISTDAAHGHVANVNYAASKHAIESYSRSAAMELGPYGITVNIIAPGPIQTGYIPPHGEESFAAQAPLRRMGAPDDIADVVVFLASTQARWLTGQLLYVGGGWRMHQ